MNPAIERWLKAYEEGRITPLHWQKVVEGRHLACAIGAFGEEINSASQCPADVMPPWLAYHTVGIFDGISAGYRPQWLADFARLLPNFYRLSNPQWERCETRAKLAALLEVLPFDITKKGEEAYYLLVLKLQGREVSARLRGLWESCSNHSTSRLSDSQFEAIKTIENVLWEEIPRGTPERWTPSVHSASSSAEACVGYSVPDGAGKESLQEEAESAVADRIGRSTLVAIAKEIDISLSPFLGNPT